MHFLSRLPNNNPQGKVGPNQAVFGLTIFMGGLAQLIACFMEFRVGNTFGTALHGSYGAFWLSYGMFLIPSLGIADAYGGDAHALSFAMGVYLIAWDFLSLLFLLGALRTNWCIVITLITLVLAFFLLALAEFTATEHPQASLGLNKAGGAFTLITGTGAFYAGAAGLMDPKRTFVRFPLGPISERNVV